MRRDLCICSSLSNHLYFTYEYCFLLSIQIVHEGGEKMAEYGYTLRPCNHAITYAHLGVYIYVNDRQIILLVQSTFSRASQ